MPNLQRPIEVSDTTAPYAAAFRYLLVIGLTALVASGRVEADNVEGIASAVMTVGTVLYGLWKTRKTKAELIVVAEAVSDRVAVVNK